MIFLGKNACNRIIFITFAVKCISSTRRFKSISTRLQSSTRRFAENPSEFSLLREDLFLCKTKSQFEITKKGVKGLLILF